MNLVQHDELMETNPGTICVYGNAVLYQVTNTGGGRNLTTKKKVFLIVVFV